MKKVRNFRELEVYQLARELAKEIFDVSKTFPKEEMYSLTDQIRRASRSIGAQIAEAWGKRKYEKHFVSKLTDSYSEQLETQHWIDSSFDCSYINQTTAKQLLSKCTSIGNMLESMIDKSSWFCD